MTVSRRSLLGGIGALLAAPAIVRAGSLMPVKAPPLVMATPDMPLRTLAERAYDKGFTLTVSLVPVGVLTPEARAEWDRFVTSMARPA